MEIFDEIEDRLNSIEPVEDDADQDVNNWQTQRLGKITGSQVGKLIVKSKDKKGYELSSGKVATDLLYRVAWERFLTAESDGLNRLNINSKPTDHGNEYEQEAILKYEEITGNKVIRGDVFQTKNEYFGGTPDGYIGDDALIEVKCPYNGGNHIKTLITGEIYNPEYYYQMQSYLSITGRKWVDFVTYDPDMPEGLNISITKVYRDEEVIEAIDSVVKKAADIVNEIMEQIKSRCDGRMERCNRI